MSKESFVPEIKTLEQIPGDTGEGFILTTLRVVEDVGNNLAEKDVYTNKNIPIFISDYFENLRKYIEERGNTVTFPKDEILQIAFYVEKVLKKILESPKFNIEKVETFLHFSRVKNLDSKSMAWLGKQPGRTAREKIGAKEKILTKVSRHNFQTKENAVVVAFLKLLLPILSKRIEANEKEFKEKMDSGYIKLCKYYSDIKRKYRKSDLDGVVGKFDNNPNNTLINDRNYSVIYRAYRQLKQYNRKIKEDWKYPVERFTSVVFLNVLSKLENLKESYYENSIFRIVDNNRSIILEHGVNERLDNMNFAFLKLNEKSKPETLNMNIQLEKDMITVEFKKEKIQFKFFKSENSGDITVEMNDKKIEDIYTVDSTGFEKISQFIADEIKRKFGISHDIKEEMQEISFSSRGFGMDFTPFCPVLCDENIVTDEYYKKFGMIKSLWENRERYFYYRPGIYYSSENNFVPMNSIFSEEESILPFTKSMEKLFETSHLDKNSYFTFAVPDNLDEFSQKPVQAIIESRCDNSFPVWRSIGAGIAWYKNGGQLEKNESLLVLDFNSEDISATKLKFIETDDKKRKFEHYPCFKDEMKENNVQIRFFKDYITEVTKHLELSDYHIDSIVNTGIAQKIIKNRKHEVFYTGSQFVTVEYNEKIYLKMVENILGETDKFILELKEKYYGNEDIKTFILGSYINEDAKKKLGKKIYISDEEVASGVYEISQRLRKGEDTWEEYLPDLSLEIIKDGCYGEFPLIKNERVTPLYGSVNKIEISGNLILAKGKKNYRFPLLKQESENKSRMYEAKLESDAFPLKEDLPVKLCIYYSYGVENNYRLMVYPDDEKKKPFDELEAKWESLESHISFSKLEIPPVEISESRAYGMQDGLTKLLQTCRNFFATGNYDKLNIILSQMKKMKNGVRQCRMKYFFEFDDEWDELSEELKIEANHLYDIFAYGTREELERIRSYYRTDRKDMEKMAGHETDVIALFLCALGGWKDTSVFKTKKKLSNDQLRCLGYILSAEYDKVLALVLLNHLDEKSKNKNGLVIDIVSGIVKYNSEFLTKLGQICNINDILVKYIQKDIESLMIEFENKKEKFRENRDKAWEVLEPYRKHCELLVYLLNDENLNLTVEERYRLAKNIKKIDRDIYEEELTNEYNTKIKFEISSVEREGLHNMLPISYVVVQQLIGENNSNLIRVVEVSEDD